MKRHTSVAADFGKSSRQMTNRPKGKSPVHKRAQKRFQQFLICGAIFVLVVAFKLLLPGKAGPLAEHIGRALNRNMDVQAVFSVVGDVVSRELPPAEAVEEVYQAVFPSSGKVAEAISAPEKIPEDTALNILRSYRVAGADGTRDNISELAYVLYTDENIPENVTLEQEILGFDYCVPVAAPVSSSFGYREHPMQGEDRFHYGVDLAADAGSSIACFANGKVNLVGESSSYGKYCIISHANGYQTLYAHCSRISVTSGAEVLRGEKIGEVGETGMATGPHLHFELQHEGTYLNPIYYVAA